MTITKISVFVSLISILLFIFIAFALGEEVDKKPAKETVAKLVTGTRPETNTSKASSEIKGIIKYEEIFADTIPPAGWQSIDDDGSGTSWEYYEGIDFTSGDSVRPQAGVAFWANNYNNANGTIIRDWLITPRLPMLEAGDSLYVWVNAIGMSSAGNYLDTITVWVSITDSSIANFGFPIGMIVDPGPTGEWHLYSLDITFDSTIVGFEPFVGFKHDHLDGGPTGSGSNWVHLDHVILANGGLVTTIGDKNTVQPSNIALKQNYPNPFNPTTTITYDLQKNSNVMLKIYNLSGQEVKTLVDENQSAGTKQVIWNGKDNNGAQVASGIYLYKLHVGNVVQAKKMILLK